MSAPAAAPALQVMTLGPTLREVEWGSGYVYVLQEDAPGGFVKIGRTVDLAGRITAFEKASPRSLVIRAVFRETDDLERDLLYRFALSRVRGEWFHPTWALLDFAAENYDPDIVLEALEREERPRLAWPT